ncbi:unnamed protein product [Pleuronectes platessa]|uniref:Uncharacterized protein n=1 Tax=Pleuronectes platessa TaxID=8262 RepID=A0A9N7VRI8_PLEPL|nr:unnamed protein product [Pleuronectes platessa]
MCRYSGVFAAGGEQCATLSVRRLVGLPWSTGVKQSLSVMIPLQVDLVKKRAERGKIPVCSPLKYWSAQVCHSPADTRKTLTVAACSSNEWGLGIAEWMGDHWVQAGSSQQREPGRSCSGRSTRGLNALGQVFFTADPSR